MCFSASMVSQRISLANPAYHELSVLSTPKLFRGISFVFVINEINILS